MALDEPIFWRIERRGRIVRLVRTDLAYRSLDDARGAHLELIDQISALGVDRPRCAQLVDLRAGPLRTDPAFEAAIGDLRARIFEGFTAGAVHVRTFSGKLQLHRLERSDRAYRTFDDEEEALAYLEAVLDGTLTD